MKHHIIIYDVDWQVLRISLLGKFVNKDEIDTNLNTLENYILKAKTYQDLHDRLFRVINLLNAVRMGFYGMKLIGSDLDKKIIQRRNIYIV